MFGDFRLTMRSDEEWMRPVLGSGKVVLEEDGTWSMKGNIFHLIASDKPFDRWWSRICWQEGWRRHSYMKHSILNLVDILIPSQTVLAELKDALQQNITLSKKKSKPVSKDSMSNLIEAMEFFMLAIGQHCIGRDFICLSRQHLSFSNTICLYLFVRDLSLAD